MRGKRWLRDVRSGDLRVYGYHRTWEDAMAHACWAVANEGGRWEVRRNTVHKARYRDYVWYARRIRRWWQA